MKGGRRMKKELKPVTNYVEPEYPEIEGIVASEEADCLEYDVCTYSYGWGMCYNGVPMNYLITYRRGCSCQDSQCECQDAWYDWW